MTDKLRTLDKMAVAIGYLDEHVEEWSDWKIRLIIKKVDDLQRLMETTDRRSANGI